MTLRHVERLRRARALLAVKGYDTNATTLACYSGAGFDPASPAAARDGDVLLVGLDRLYQPARVPARQPELALQAAQEVDQAC